MKGWDHKLQMFTKTCVNKKRVHRSRKKGQFLFDPFETKCVGLFCHIILWIIFAPSKVRASTRRSLYSIFCDETVRLFS